MGLVHILHIVHTLNRGGMESRIMDLYRNLDRTRFQFDFYVESGKRGIFDNEIDELGGRIFYSGGISRYNIPDFSSFYRFLNEHKEYKIIYAYNQWAGFYLKEAKKCGVEHRIAYARTSLQTKSLKNIIKNLAKLNVNKYATHRFAVSKKAASWLFGKKVTDTGIVNIWPNAIDTQKLAFSDKIREEVRREIGLIDEMAILHIGNIRFEKNHKFLIKVFSEIKKRNENVKLILIGGGNIEDLMSQIKALGIENFVMYLGVRQDIPRLLQAGDIFIFPSLYEGFPGAVLEAEASGLNCLISDSITDEILLTEHIVSMSLKEDVQKWVEAVESFGSVDRKNAWKEIKNAGYDIHNLIEKTQSFFNSLLMDS